MNLPLRGHIRSNHEETNTHIHTSEAHVPRVPWTHRYLKLHAEGHIRHITALWLIPFSFMPVPLLSSPQAFFPRCALLSSLLCVAWLKILIERKGASKCWRLYAELKSYDKHVVTLVELCCCCCFNSFWTELLLLKIAIVNPLKIYCNLCFALHGYCVHADTCWKDTPLF